MDKSFDKFREAVEACEPQDPQKLTQERALGDGRFLRRIFDAAERAGVLDALMSALLGRIGGQ